MPSLIECSPNCYKTYQFNDCFVGDSIKINEQQFSLLHENFCLNENKSCKFNQAALIQVKNKDFINIRSSACLKAIGYPLPKHPQTSFLMINFKKELFGFKKGIIFDKNNNCFYFKKLRVFF